MFSAWLLLLFVMTLGSGAIHAFSWAQAYPASTFSLWSGLATREGGQDYMAALAVCSHTIVPLLVATSLALCVWGRRVHRADPASGRYADEVSMYALPALAVWVLSELWLSVGFAGVELDYYLEQTLAPARDLASARLDHPWPLAGAAFASALSFAGAKRVRRREASWTLLGLAVYALLRAIVDLVSYRAARAIVADRAALLAPERWGAIAAGLALLSTLVLATTLAWGVRALRRGASPPHPGGESTALGCLIAIAALCAIDVTGFVGVRQRSASERLATVLAQTNTRPLTAPQLGGGIHDNFAVLHQDGSLTLVVADRMWNLSREQALPTPGGKLVLIADERCPIAELRRRAEQVPARYTLMFGRVASRAPRLLRPLGPARAARLMLKSAPFVAADASLPLWPDAHPQDLATFPTNAKVGTLAEDEPLRTARAPDRVHPLQLPAPASAPRGAPMLFAFGF